MQNVKVTDSATRVKTVSADLGLQYFGFQSDENLDQERPLSHENFSLTKFFVENIFCQKFVFGAEILYLRKTCGENIIKN